MVNKPYFRYDDEDMNKPGIYNMISMYESKYNIASILIKIREGEYIMDRLFNMNY